MANDIKTIKTTDGASHAIDASKWLGLGPGTTTGGQLVYATGVNVNPQWNSVANISVGGASNANVAELAHRWGVNDGGTSVYFTAPSNYGTSGQVLVTDGSGGTTWSSISSGGGSITTADANAITDNSYVMQISNVATVTTASRTTWAAVRTWIDASAHTFSQPITVNNSLTASTVYTQSLRQSSDERLKNIHEELDLDKCYEMIDKCSAIIYDFKDDPNHQEQVGMIAQEVQKFFPEIVSEDANGFLALDYSKISVIIFRVMKSLIDRVKKLEEKS